MRRVLRSRLPTNVFPNTKCSTTFCCTASKRTTFRNRQFQNRIYSRFAFADRLFFAGDKRPVGTIIHTGDYKIDETPVIGKPYDLKTLKKYGDEGVLALLGDSTNATVPGRTPSEQAVIPAFEEIFEQAEGRIIVSTLFVVASSLASVFDVAHSITIEKFACSVARCRKTSKLLRIWACSKFRTILWSNSANRALRRRPNRLSGDRFAGRIARRACGIWRPAVTKVWQIEKGDTVVLSARIIPGNDRAISRLIGDLYKHGGNIIEEKRRLIHVSGHASQEDIKIMTETARPKYRRADSRRIPDAFPPQGIHQKSHRRLHGRKRDFD
jgi:ribonuclease J